MMVRDEWRRLGWRHVVWDLVRYYLSLRGRRQAAWLEELQQDNALDVDGDARFPIAPSDVRLFLDYLAMREQDFQAARALLRMVAALKSDGLSEAGARDYLRA